MRARGYSSGPGAVLCFFLYSNCYYSKKKVKVNIKYALGTRCIPLSYWSKRKCTTVNDFSFVFQATKNYGKAVQLNWNSPQVYLKKSYILLMVFRCWYFSHVISILISKACEAHSYRLTIKIFPCGFVVPDHRHWTTGVLLCRYLLFKYTVSKTDLIFY